MSSLFSMLLDYALHLDLIWRCKDTNYFSFHQIYPQLFSPIPKDLTFPPFAFNTSLPPTFFVHRFPQIIFSTDVFLSTDYHRLTQIIFWGTEILGFQRHGLAPHWYFPRHFVIRACLASSRLSFIFHYFNFQFIKPCLYFSIALRQIKPFPSRSPAVPFLKSRVHPCLK